jgi:hypothetical protein
MYHADLSVLNSLNGNNWRDKMTVANEKSEDALSVQEHCIDLPGEAVQCWIGGGTHKLKVILRKHRDVIFDIHIGNGKNYTVETTDSDFYSVRDKKLIYARRHGKVNFKDGERIHFWISRGFRGALILKCEGHIISEVKPNEWDTHSYTADPREKPAPIIVAIGHSSSQSKSTGSSISTQNIVLNDKEQSVHVYEVSKKGAPSAILKFFEDGGESLNLDSDDIITRNWITGQLAGIVGYTVDNHTWMRELYRCKFYLQKVHHRTGTRTYLVFSGNNRTREVISASRYSLNNSKIIQLTGGAGGVKQGWDTMKGAAKDSLKVISKEEGKMVIKGGIITIILTIGLDAAEWYKDYSEIDKDGKPKKDFYDLCTRLGTDLAKGALTAALTTASIAIVLSAVAIAGAITLPVVFIIVGTIGISMLWAYGIEKLDKVIAHSIDEEDLATWMAKRFREIAKHLSNVSKDVRYEDYSAIPI